jgi:hypothetical protein
MDILKELDELQSNLQRAVNDINDNHSWSRQLTRYDGNIIFNLSKQLQEYSNKVYLIRQELMGNR